MIEIIHNSYDLFYRNPFGAVENGSDINIAIKIKAEENIEYVDINIINDNVSGEEETVSVKMELEAIDGEYQVYSTNIHTRKTIGLVWYYFTIKTESETYYYGNNSDSLGGVGDIYKHIPPSYQITTYSKENTTPNWFKEGIIYQIFPDRFYNGNEDGSVLAPNRDMLLRGNWNEEPEYIRDCDGRVICFDFFGGNLKGIIKKLDYLKELGTSIIYLNPIFDAASNHKYDTSDYKKIDPMFGDEEIFKELCKKADEVGINIILDGVFSHTGSDSIYFNKENNYDTLGAYQSKESEYYSWYKFKKYPDEYESWWGVDVLPNVNELDKGYQDYIINDEDSVVSKWIKCGAKGWRLDVADELPGEFIRNFKARMREVDKESVLIGEVWEDASNKISYGTRRDYLLGDKLDSVMNYPFKDTFIDFLTGKIDSQKAYSKMMSLYENYPMHQFYSNMNLIGTHDTKRVLTELEGCIKKLKLLVLIQMTFPGVPSIYYGDEVGVEGYKDPSNRKTYPWGNENLEILNWYKKVTKIRNKYDVLRTGSFKPLSLDGDVFGYVRQIKNSQDVFGQTKEDNTFLVLINRSNEEINLNIGLKEFKINKVHDILDENPIEVENDKSSIKVPPLSGKILLKTK